MKKINKCDLFKLAAIAAFLYLIFGFDHILPLSMFKKYQHRLLWIVLFNMINFFFGFFMGSERLLALKKAGGRWRLDSSRLLLIVAPLLAVIILSWVGDFIMMWGGEIPMFLNYIRGAILQHMTLVDLLPVTAGFAFSGCFYKEQQTETGKDETPEVID